MSNNYIIVFDTETTGFSPERNEIVQLSYILYDITTQTVVYATEPGADIVNINGAIPKETSDVHGITKSMTLDKEPIEAHIDRFIEHCNRAKQFVGHNIKFDIKMICGQMKKIIKNNQDVKAAYQPFLQRFAMVGKNLPEDAYCTMEQSSDLCTDLLGKKKAKLMEVHKLLFNQDVHGQLHNALVDISVTLRVYLQLTKGIDICKSMTKFSKQVKTVTDNYSICSLINPGSTTTTTTKAIDYSGELIVGYKVKANALIENAVTVESVAKQMVEKITSNAVAKLSKKPDQEIICTSVKLCSSTIKSGVRQNEICGRKIKLGEEFCGYHNSTEKSKPKSKSKSKTPSPIISKFSQSFVSKLLSRFTRKNKVVPIGGSKSIHK